MDQVLTWAMTGVGAGWLTRTLMRSRRDFGVVGDLVTGCLGALLGGWSLRHLHVLAPDNVVGHAGVALVGAAILLALVRALAALGAAAGVSTMPSATTATIEQRLATLTQFERAVLARLLSRDRAVRDPTQRHDADATLGERVADRVAAFGGSWTFIGLFAIVMLTWMALNEEAARPFDPYPFILLNLVLSCLAALQAPIIMMSQNRQASRDRADARNDYEVNLRAEMDIASVHTKLDLMRERDWERLLDVVAQQQRTLAQMHSRLDALVPSHDRDR